MPSRMRKTYVYDPLTKTMVFRPVQDRELLPEIMPDIPDFVSTVDGSIVHGRRGLREHNLRHGTTNIADYTETWKKNLERRAAFAEGRLEDPKRKTAVVEAFNRLEERNRNERNRR